MRIVFFANPVSGAGRAARRANQIVEALRAEGHDSEAVIPGSREEMDARVRELSREVDRIGVVGGDGTVQRVLQNLPTDIPVDQRPPLATVPEGTANVLARELGWPLRATATALGQLAVSGGTRKIDLLKLSDGTLSQLGLGAGFDGAVVHKVHEKRSGKISMLNYVLPAISSWLTAGRNAVSLDIDGERVFDRAAFVAIWNTRNYGGVFRAFPGACVDDGLFEVAVVPRVGVLSMFAFTMGWQRGFGIQRFRGSRFRIEPSGGAAYCQLNGDTGPPLPIDAEVMPKALHVVSPVAAT